MVATPHSTADDRTCLHVLRAQALCALLCLCLLVVQAFVTVHAIDLDRHHGHDACRLCVGLAAVDGADLEPGLLALPPAQPVMALSPAVAELREIRHFRHLPIRAPPGPTSEPS